LESKLSWLIIINNCNSALGVFSLELFTIFSIELDEEVLIWFPTIVINDLDIENFISLSFSKSDNSIDSNIIITSNSLGINSLNSDGALFLRLIQERNLQSPLSFGN
jgi:hypothetical protein